MTARKRTPKWLQAARASGEAWQPAQRNDWIARALARAGVLSAEDAREAVRAGRVSIGGRLVREPLAVVRAGDEIRLDGRVVSLEAETIVLAFHKPAGVVTSTTDPEGQGTVFERLHAVLPRELAGYGWHAVGRLDRNTTGLLLFTNDERFVAHATAPETHLSKRYLASVLGTPTDEKLEPLRRGIEVEGVLLRPAIAKLRPPSDVELTLTEGRYHQVKKMLGAVGLPVKALHREAVGGLELDVPEGGYRRLGPEEIRERLGYQPRTGVLRKAAPGV